MADVSAVLLIGDPDLRLIFHGIRSTDAKDQDRE